MFGDTLFLSGGNPYNKGTLVYTIKWFPVQFGINLDKFELLLKESLIALGSVKSKYVSLTWELFYRSYISGCNNLYWNNYIIIWTKIITSLSPRF